MVKTTKRPVRSRRWIVGGLCVLASALAFQLVLLKSSSPTITSRVVQAATYRTIAEGRAHAPFAIRIPATLPAHARLSGVHVFPDSIILSWTTPSGHIDMTERLNAATASQGPTGSRPVSIKGHMAYVLDDSNLFADPFSSSVEWATGAMQYDIVVGGQHKRTQTPIALALAASLL